MINEATDMAGIDQSLSFTFSTHCFRRGGAQYCFVHAPIGEQWPLDWIRWWGGWAKNETVIYSKYLSQAVPENLLTG